MMPKRTFFRVISKRCGRIKREIDITDMNDEQIKRAWRDLRVNGRFEFAKLETVKTN